MDLPGAQSVATGIAVAMKGYRPVPLYNSCNGPMPVVDLSELMDVIADGTEALKQRPIHDESPPSFLLDSRRMTGTPLPARFDNRWMTFPQDFPSASFRAGQALAGLARLFRRRPNRIGMDEPENPRKKKPCQPGRACLLSLHQKSKFMFRL